MRVLGTIAFALLAGAGCRLFDNDNELRNVTLDAEISTELGVDDTLIVIRQITNRGSEMVWLDVSSATAAYEIRNAANQPACQMGPTSLEATFVGVPPAANFTDTRKLAVSSLQNCTPGTYSVRVIAAIHKNGQGTDAPSILRSTLADLVITPP